MLGRVKWFNPDKGYGFIERDDGAGDHVRPLAAARTSRCETPPLTGTATSPPVRTWSSTIGEGRKGPEAQNVQVITDIPVVPDG